MTTFALNALIHQAATELGSEACREGRHRWGSIGGRSCPKDYTSMCSQAVYVCSTCGETDYGARGGPGHHDCSTTCRHKP